MKKAIPYIIVLGMIAVIFGVRFLRPEGSGAPPFGSKTSETFAMGAVCRITAFYPAGADASAMQAIDAAFLAVHKVDEACSLYSDTSDISRVNKGGSSGDIKTGDIFIECLSRALDMSRKTKGLFDPAIGPLVALWGFGPSSAGTHVPSADEIAAVIPLIDPSGIIINPADRTVRLKNPGMAIDLNGIAQGFASEEAGAVLLKMGVTSALIESGGGEFVAIGSKAAGEPFRIGIRKPRRDSQDIIAYVLVSDVSLATSGDYEKYFEADGRRFSHLMDPRTGMTKSGTPTSVTVLGKSCTVCDALATVAAILSPGEAKQVVSAFPGYEVIIAAETADGPEFTFSAGLARAGDTFSFRR